MLVNASNLAALRTGFQTSFQRGLGMAAPQWDKVATLVPAATREVKYGWLGKMPSVREWIGPRAVQNLQQHDYSIREKKFELTVSVERDDVETDNLGIYTPMFEDMGHSTRSHYDLLVFALLKAGFSSLCYDGQYFFDADHPVLDANGQPTSVANTDGGAGTPWFLMCTNRPLKPLILQRRRDFEFVAKDDPKDDNVFSNNEFVYAADARANVGFGFWQFAWGSRQTLSGANYATARAALTGMKGDYGRPLGLMPNLLVVPPALESAARKIVNSENSAGGETNEWKGTAELMIASWLA